MLSVTISQSSQAFLGLCGFSVVETFAGKRWWVVSLKLVLVSRMVATHEVQCCISVNLYGSPILCTVGSFTKDGSGEQNYSHSQGPMLHILKLIWYTDTMVGAFIQGS